MRRQLLVIFSIATIFFLAGTMVSFTALANDRETPFDEIWQAITGIQTRVTTLEAEVEALKARVEALENETPTPTVEIKIEAYPTTDYFFRYHGLSIDEPLPTEFWLVNGYTFKVTASAFTYVTTVSLAHGQHYVEYATSGVAVPSYLWYARIYINSILTVEGEVERYHPLRANFEV